jgi:hypothetical protein
MLSFAKSTCNAGHLVVVMCCDEPGTVMTILARNGTFEPFRKWKVVISTLSPCHDEISHLPSVEQSRAALAPQSFDWGASERGEKTKQKQATYTYRYRYVNEPE